MAFQGEKDGGNPVARLVQQFAADRSNWQEQFRAQEAHAYNVPPHVLEEQRMMAQFMNAHEREEQFRRFDGRPPPDMLADPRRMPPGAFNRYVQHHVPPRIEEMLEFSEAESKRYEGHHSPMSSSSYRPPPEMERHTHADWIRAYQEGPDVRDMERVWVEQRRLEHRPPQPLPMQWRDDFLAQSEEARFAEVFEEQKGKEWTGEFLEEVKASQGSTHEWQRLADQVSQIDDERLQSSEFMRFLSGMASGDLKIDGNRVVPREDAGRSFADAFVAEEKTAPPGEWAEAFRNESEQDMFSEAWAEKFKDDWVKSYEENDWQPDSDLYEEYNRIWEEQKQLNREEYSFADSENPYAQDPRAYEKGIKLFEEGNLPEAIQALEAAVQQDPQNADAWTKLGVAQAENDKDVLAIRALEEAVRIDPNHLEAWIALAVSCTNEFRIGRLSEALFEWMAHHPKYASLVRKEDIVPGDEHGSMRRVEQRLIECVRVGGRQELDPDVQVGLGLIYNSSFEYDKAISCFKAALSRRPDDYALWNKLGATTANSSLGRQNAGDAIDCYFRALEKKPTYTRARANLGISFMSASDYVEAAKCFLGALAINNSPHLWDNLRTVFSMMERPDLLDLCAQKNVDAFRNEFNF